MWATLHCGARASHGGGFSCCRARALGARASVAVARGLSSCGLQALERRSVIVVHGLSCSAACGIFPDQGSNPGPLHWQADSQPLCHQGSPDPLLILEFLAANFNLEVLCSGELKYESGLFHKWFL